MDECDEFGRIFKVEGEPAQRRLGATRCCAVWDTRCPTCAAGRNRSCFMRCRCHCDGCAVGRVWHAPDRYELFPDEQWCNMPNDAQEVQEGSE